MGIEDRDVWREAQKVRSPGALSRGLKWAPLGIVMFWLVVMGLLYALMTHYLQPRPVRISANGDLVIPRARNGHFYAAGSVNGKPVSFMVDTGASMVTVSETFARQAGISGGVATVFKTANGDLAGRIVADVPVTLGPIRVSGVRLAVGLVGGEPDDALLGQGFLSKFEVILSKDQMILRPRQADPGLAGAAGYLK
ncbi:MAG: TIGR02281 family clan AA aspartic protease [Rhodoferax sp.]|nr:TIGR02281 family clan AA aspartic protease [Rhodoferax sp.]